MSFLGDVRLVLRISRAQQIARRYFVTNGFDGALTMLGLALGFYVGDAVSMRTVVNVCVGVAIALMMSGLSSAYISESAERRRELLDLKQAMVADLGDSAHERAARYVPWLIAAVNGIAPFLMAMAVVMPLWLAILGVPLPVPPLQAAIALGFVVIFLLGVFLGRVSGTFWLWSATRTLLIGGVTAALILLVDIDSG